MKNFSSTWISPGSESVAKDSVEKHVQGAQHLAAVDHVQCSHLGGATYHAAVVKNMPIGCGLHKMCDKDRETMCSRTICGFQGSSCLERRKHVPILEKRIETIILQLYSLNVLQRSLKTSSRFC